MSAGEGGRCAHLLCALALYGDEQAPALALWVAQRCGEVRAPHHTQLDVAVLDERETDGILLADEEALGTVDWIEHLHPCARLFSVTSCSQYGNHGNRGALTTFGPTGVVFGSMAARRPKPPSPSSPGLRGAWSASFATKMSRSRRAVAAAKSMLRSTKSSSPGRSIKHEDVERDSPRKGGAQQLLIRLMCCGGW